MGNLAKFKAWHINEFVRTNNIETIIEHGCGDGNQLKYAEYKSYIGYDVSPKAIESCRNIFMKDKTKSFRPIAEYRDETAQLTLSLDVVYHLIENNVYFDYMKRLFNSAKKFVIIYSSNYEGKQRKTCYVRRRKFTDWVKTNEPQWQVLNCIPNDRYSQIKGNECSQSDFYFFYKTGEI